MTKEQFLRNVNNTDLECLKIELNFLNFKKEKTQQDYNFIQLLKSEIFRRQELLK